MQEHARMMAAWKAAYDVCVLVTVVATHGSSYRSPGARMLILPDGSRIGAVSGGCLEGELCRRAHWWTARTPAVLKRFDTSSQEDNEGFGLGCGGGIELLVERLPVYDRENVTDAVTHPLLAQARTTATRTAAAVAVVLEPAAGLPLQVGERIGLEHARPEVAGLLRRSMEMSLSFTTELADGSRVFFESLVPPVQVLICGAGGDAQPMVEQSAALGWTAIVLDQRADLAHIARFPDAERVLAVRERTAIADLRLDTRTAAIVMSHSFAQDTFFLQTLLDAPIAYLGVLGARRRTMDLLAALGREAAPANLFAPAGLDIGAETPEQIALSILSEVQACFAGRHGGALRERHGSIHGRELLDVTDDSPGAAGSPACSRFSA